MQDIFQVGAVTATHGLAGEVKVYPMTDDPARFKKLRSVLLETKEGMKELEIEQVRFFKQMVILKFRGSNRIEDVQPYCGCGLYVTREHAVRLKKDEYFIADLIGLAVYTEDGNLLGELTNVLKTGANDVYEVRLTDGREVLIPAIHQCILDVDIENGTMKVHLLEGLLE